MTGKFNSSYNAFTLAEILITLGIIGVVAAMTIPNIISTYKAARLRSQFLKSYSTIQQAFRQMRADDISTDFSDYVSNSGSLYSVLKSYFSGVHDCGHYLNTSSALPCAGAYPTYKTLDGKNTVYRNWFDDGQFVLSDSTLIFIENPNMESSHVYILIDLNGYARMPNRLGYDLFVLQFVNQELVTMGDSDRKSVV